MMSFRNWSDLLEELLILITKKLQSPEDIFLFGSVCASWRSASKTVSLNGTRQLPWLLQSKVGNGKYKYMFDYARGKQYRATKLSYKFKNWYLGWKGWVLLVTEDGTMCLRHAFKKTGPISLPKIPYFCGTYKAALSSDPFISASDYTLAIIYGTQLVYEHQLALWRPGDKSYTGMLIDDVQDAIFHGGLLYAVNQDRIVVFDVTGPNPVTTYQINGKIPCDLNQSDNYLVEVGGNIMLLLEFEEDVKDGGPDYQFKVFLVSELSEWKEVKDLGNRAIFIGTNNQSFALDNASEIQGCRPNHIYFTESGWGVHNVNVYTYNLTNATVGNFYYISEKSHHGYYHTSLWVQPVFD